MWTDIVLEHFWAIMLYILGAWILFNNSKLTKNGNEISDGIKFIISLFWPFLVIIGLFIKSK